MRPNPNWTLFDECNDGSKKNIQFVADSGSSPIFRRMLELETALIAAKKDGTVCDLKEKYDRFGKLLE